MIHILFYVCIAWYYIQLWFIENFDPIGKEFANVVIFGLLANLTKTERKVL